MSKIHSTIPGDPPPNNQGPRIITSDSFEMIEHSGEESSPLAVWCRRNHEVIARHADRAQVELKKRELEQICGHSLNNLVVWIVPIGFNHVNLFTDEELRKRYDVGPQNPFDQSRKVHEIFRALHMKHSFELEYPDGRREQKPANTVVLKYDDGTISFMSWAEFQFTVTPWDRENRRPLTARNKEKGALPKCDEAGLDELWAKFSQGLGQKTR